jgi:hypothetical protein
MTHLTTVNQDASERASHASDGIVEICGENGRFKRLEEGVGRSSSWESQSDASRQPASLTSTYDALRGDTGQVARRNRGN